jgi:nucleoside-diphosphate-sugar epimerase
MRIAILGATSQIAKDFIGAAIARGDDDELFLYARRPDAVRDWLHSVRAGVPIEVRALSEFGAEACDVLMNFIGVGDPARAIALGASIFDLTLHYDSMALDYLRTHDACRYLFLSSGAVYGTAFTEPVTQESVATVCVNDLSPSGWYGAAKLHAECRHRSLVSAPIVDIRVFNYFSRTQDLSQRFLLTDIVRSLRDETVLKTSPHFLARDYLHPTDFYGIVRAILRSPPANAAVDCYSLAPIDKPSLLKSMQDRFGLRYEYCESAGLDATAIKPHYYSLNRRAADFGYAPTRTSLAGIMEEVDAIRLNW